MSLKNYENVRTATQSPPPPLSLMAASSDPRLPSISSLRRFSLAASWVASSREASRAASSLPFPDLLRLGALVREGH
jgi:hypothetical protein